MSALDTLLRSVQATAQEARQRRRAEHERREAELVPVREKALRAAEEHPTYIGVAAGSVSGGVGFAVAVGAQYVCTRLTVEEVDVVCRLLQDAARPHRR